MPQAAVQVYVVPVGLAGSDIADVGIEGMPVVRASSDPPGLLIVLSLPVARNGNYEG